MGDLDYSWLQKYRSPTMVNTELKSMFENVSYSNCNSEILDKIVCSGKTWMDRKAAKEQDSKYKCVH